MSITDELRRYAANWEGWFYDDKDGGLIQAIGHVPAQSTPVPKVINAFADRIDAEHAKAVERARMDGMDSTFGDGWVKLPADADGVPIRVGDYVETLIEAFEGERGWVECLTLTEDGWCVDGDRPSTVRHVQPDSWERIIEDAVKLGYADYPTTSYEAELVERCKRLAGE